MSIKCFCIYQTVIKIDVFESFYWVVKAVILDHLKALTLAGNQIGEEAYQNQHDLSRSISLRDQ